jgi:hypothetical protein
VVEPGLTDRAVPSTVVWDRDRDKALNDLCESWPARWWVGDDAAAHVGPPYPAVMATDAPVLTLTDGTLGTVTGRTRSAQRGALFNVIVVDGKAPDDGTAGPHSLKEITDPTHPLYAAGPYGRVTRFYASDLITTQGQADATAANMLQTFSTMGRAEQCTCVPDPSAELGDVAKLYTRDGDAFIGRINAIELPLTPDDAPMSVAMTMTPAAAPGFDRSI